METGTSGTSNNTCIDVCQRSVNCNYETTGEAVFQPVIADCRKSIMLRIMELK